MLVEGHHRPEPGGVDPVHFLHIDRKHHFVGATLPGDAAARIEAAFRSASWYRDKWGQRLFRDTVRQIRREQDGGGLVLIGPGVRVDPPPPFTEFFEPIELGQGDPQLKTLTGEAPTRQETFQRWFLSILGGLLVLGFGVLMINFLFGRSGVMPLRLLLIPIGVIAAALTLGMVISGSQRWFLLPGGVAIVRSRKRDPDEKLVTLTRAQATGVLRYISTGKTSVLTLELWDDAGGSWSRMVTEREAAAFFAAWQSPLPMPSREDLQELPM